MALTEVVAAPTGQGLGTPCLAEQVWLQLDAQRLHAGEGGEPEVAAGPGQLSCGRAQVAAQEPQGRWGTLHRICTLSRWPGWACC